MTRLKLDLTKLQEKQLKETYHKTKDVKIRDRCQSILLKNLGYSLDEISAILDVNIRTIKLWTKLYREGGISNLEPKPQIGNHRKLTNDEKEEIKKTLDTNTPSDFGYDERFWTVTLLRAYIKDKFSVEYKSDRSYHAIFKFCNFSFHKPKKKDRRQDPAKVKEFEDEIKKNLQDLTTTQSYWQRMN